MVIDSCVAFFGNGIRSSNLSSTSLAPISSPRWPMTFLSLQSSTPGLSGRGRISPVTTSVPPVSPAPEAALATVKPAPSWTRLLATSPSVEYSDGQVRFSLVLRAFFLNPELDPQFGSTYCAELRTEWLVLVLKGSVPVN